MMNSKILIAGLIGAFALAACERTQVVLPGLREDVRSIGNELATDADLVNTAQPISLPASRANSSWFQRIGSPATREGNPALRANPGLIWSTDIGQGDGRRNRITADPVVADGRIFAMDAEARVTAVSTSGSVLWSQDLTPVTDNSSDSGGGGLAYGNGVLFVTSGFGTLTALDPSTGAQFWQQELRASAAGSPAYRDGIVYVVSGDEIAWAIDAETGRINWQLSSTPDVNNVMGAQAPAISDKYVIFPFGSGALQGAFRKGGLRLWDAQIAGQRAGFSGALIGDISSDPVIADNQVYVGTSSGRTVALNLGNGRRVWTANDGPSGQIWPAGGSIFLVSDRNELLRLSAEDGSRIWAQSLPFFTKDKPAKQKEIYNHHGPIIAGGQVVVASSDGQLRFFDPASGGLRGNTELPSGATTNPVVAGNTLYVVNRKGQLLAFR